jgi:tRNA threonylcarbamoyl adenosine modification protein (Sua5/YciO/YrdC/YwlC family)
MVRQHIHLKNPHNRIILNAAGVLSKGGLIIYPTDTVYGLGCSLYNKHAIEKLYSLKGKSKFAPVSIIVKDIKQASSYARISNYAYHVVRHCSPGPYTFILPSTREIPKNMLSKRKEIGIRIPDSEVCHALIENLGHPIATTSVNIDPAEILNSPDEIENRYQNQVDLMLDADWLPDAHESTVVSLIDDDLQILRKGKGNIQKLYE